MSQLFLLHRSQSLASTDEESDCDSITSACSATSADEEQVNARVYPHWCSYRDVIEGRGYRLDTCRDVKQFYLRYWEGLVAQGCDVSTDLPGYLRACNGQDDDDLCRDAGLPENLFRGTCCADGTKVVIKAVHMYSREYDIVRYLSTPPLRGHPMNHCIPVLDFIEVPEDKVVFIVMEEWSPHLATDPPFTLRCFLRTLRQHLEHVAFMHAYNVAHLDISLRNILTDNHTRYACIDFELSRRYDDVERPCMRYHRATEVPPELEQAGCSDPFKVDVWASGMLILRAAKLTGYEIPELFFVAQPMLHPDYEHRLTAKEALSRFNGTISMIGDNILDSCNA